MTATMDAPDQTLPGSLEPTAPGDIYELHDNGYVTVAWDTPAGFVRYTLRRPVLAEITEVIELTAIADRTLSDLGGDEHLDERRRLLNGVDSPYATAFVRALELLTPNTFDVRNLPAWAARPEVVGDLIRHWQSRPLPRGMSLPSPDAAPALLVAQPRNAPARRGVVKSARGA